MVAINMWSKLHPFLYVGACKKGVGLLYGCDHYLDFFFILLWLLLIISNWPWFSVVKVSSSDSSFIVFQPVCSFLSQSGSLFYHYNSVSGNYFLFKSAFHFWLTKLSLIANIKWAWLIDVWNYMVHIKPFIKYIVLTMQ